ncbi:MAG: tetratricopeptide repeat protein, partial [Candidatus Acidiferrales bacterium]
ALLVLLAAALAFAQEAARPLAENDIVQLLQAGVTPARAATLVEQRGISFDITPDAEARLRQAGGDDALIAAVTRAAAPPEEAIRRLTLAELRAKDGDRSAALGELAQAAKLAPHWTELHYRSGLIYESLRQYKQASASWQRYLDLRPDSPRKAEMVAKLAEWDYRREKQQNAEALVAQASEEMRKPNLPGALDLARQAVEADPDNSAAQAKLAELLATVRPSGATSLDDAPAHAREAVRLEPQSAEAHRQLSRALREKGELAEAERAARASVRLAPDLPSAHATLAVVLARRGQTAEALVEARTTARMAPDEWGMHVQVAREFSQRRDYASAVSLLREYLAEHPERTEVRVNLALMLAEQGHDDAAEQELREAVRRNPRSAFAQYELGRLLWAKKKDHAGAITPAQEAARLDPNSTWTHWLLGSVLSDAGQLDEAGRELQEALRLAPNNAVAHWNLGVVFERQRDRNAALREYREAARLEPDNQFYKEGLANAEKQPR